MRISQASNFYGINLKWENVWVGECYLLCFLFVLLILNLHLSSTLT